MKLKIKQQYKLLVFAILLSISSCQNEDNILDNLDQQNPFIQKIEYSSFLKELNYFKIQSDKLTQDIFYSQNKASGKFGNDQITLDINKKDVLKIIGANNLITYVFDAKTNDLDTREHYYKLILIAQNDKFDLKFLKFLPNEVDNLAPSNLKFKGTIIAIPLKANPLNSKGCQTVTYEQEFL
ncbi:MAG: hypothetical protein V4670_11255 [Bacteroidota bacterium]